MQGLWVMSTECDICGEITIGSRLKIWRGTAVCTDCWPAFVQAVAKAPENAKRMVPVAAPSLTPEAIAEMQGRWNLMYSGGREMLPRR